jgi:hypothetical protein
MSDEIRHCATTINGGSWPGKRGLPRACGQREPLVVLP